MHMAILVSILAAIRFSFSLSNDKTNETRVHVFRLFTFLFYKALIWFESNFRERGAARGFLLRSSLL